MNAATTAVKPVDYKSLKAVMSNLCAPVFHHAYQTHSASLIAQANADLGQEFVTLGVLCAETAKVVKPGAEQIKVEAGSFVEKWHTAPDLWVIGCLARAWLADPDRLGRHPNARAASASHERHTIEAIAEVIVAACAAYDMAPDRLKRIQTRVRARAHAHAERGERPTARLNTKELDTLLRRLPRSPGAEASQKTFRRQLGRTVGKPNTGKKAFVPFRTVKNALADQGGHNRPPHDAPGRALYLAVVEAFFEGLGYEPQLLRDFPNQPMIMPEKEKLTGSAVADAAREWMNAFVKGLQAAEQLAYLVEKIDTEVDPVRLANLTAGPSSSASADGSLESQLVEQIVAVVGEDTEAINAVIDGAKRTLEAETRVTGQNDAELIRYMERVRDLCHGVAEPPDLTSTSLHTRCVAGWRILEAAGAY